MSLRSRGGVRLRRWLLHGVRARQLTTLVLVLTGGGAVVVALLALVAREQGSPVGGVADSLVLGVPVIALGQLWAVAWGWLWRHPRVASHGLRSCFGPLDRRLGLAIVAIAVAGCTVMLVQALDFGPRTVQTAPPSPDCHTSTALESGYVQVCLGQYSYLDVDIRPAVTGAVFFAFFTVQFGVALGARRSQRTAG